LNSTLIPGQFTSFAGHKYSFIDANVTKGNLYYYKLEDIDLRGKRTMHGPVCVDWDGDGIPDDVDPTPGQPDPINPPSPSPGPSPNPGPSEPEDGTKDGKGSKYGVTRITLQGFEAHRTEEGILLQWRTGYEVDNLGFHIYRTGW
jgi:hypothetical protein